MTNNVPLIAGNWKMNGLKRDGIPLARSLAWKCGAIGSSSEVLICPPATLISEVAKVTAGSGIRIGGQDCHTEISGAHTGDISAFMLKDLGCSYIIVGHSERRIRHAEASPIIRAKAAAAHAAEMTVILCVGETAAEREKGNTLEILARQLAGSVPDKATYKNTVIAYEPVWAIGSGRTPSLKDISIIHAELRKFASSILKKGGNTRIIYGGSVTPENAGEIMEIEDVDGVLVGGASLFPDRFWSIVESSQPSE